MCICTWVKKKQIRIDVEDIPYWILKQLLNLLQRETLFFCVSDITIRTYESLSPLPVKKNIRHDVRRKSASGNSRRIKALSLSLLAVLWVTLRASCSKRRGALKKYLLQSVWPAKRSRRFNIERKSIYEFPKVAHVDVVKIPIKPSTFLATAEV